MKTNLKELLIDEEDFLIKMKEEVEPFLSSKEEEGFFVNKDGQKIYYSFYLHPEERATIVISHGFCEFKYKYMEIIYYLYEMGYSVFYMDHRGHGFSQGKLVDEDCVYVDTYEDYVADLHQYIEEIVLTKSKTRELFLFAHSMGGGIGSLFLETYPEIFKKAVLSSPLMEISTGKYAVGFVSFLASFLCLIGKKKSYTPGQHGFDGIPIFERSSALSKARYEYVFHKREEEKAFRTYGASNAWIKASIRAGKKLRKNIGKIEIPVLLCQAGKDTMVMSWAHEYAASHAKAVELHRFPESKHEIFNATKEIREEYFKLVFGFLKE